MINIVAILYCCNRSLLKTSQSTRTLKLKIVKLTLEAALNPQKSQHFTYFNLLENNQNLSKNRKVISNLIVKYSKLSILIYTCVSTISCSRPRQQTSVATWRGVACLCARASSSPGWSSSLRTASWTRSWGRGGSWSPTARSTISSDLSVRVTWPGYQMHLLPPGSLVSELHSPLSQDFRSRTQNIWTY